MLSRVVAKSQLCWACRQNLPARLGPRVYNGAFRFVERRRPYSSEPSNPIRDALKALKEDIHVPEEEGETEELPESEETTEHYAKALRDPRQPPKAFKHDLLHHKKLNIGALGESVEALIINNPNDVRRKRRLLQTIDDPLVPENAGLDGVTLEKDSDSEYSSVVWQNLEEFSPANKIISLEEFKQIMDAIVEGFTKNQLLHYYVEESSEPAAEKPHEYPWLLKRDDWTAQRPFQWTGLTPKQSQTVLIMIKRWGLTIKEEVESLGRVQLWLQPNVFRLLTQTQSNILQDLSSKTLNKSQGEKITANMEESRLSIFISRVKLQSCLETLDHYLQGLKTRRVPVEHVDSRHLGQKVLTELARITKTSIEYDKDTKKLQVTWIPGEGAEFDASENYAPAEDPADIASRLLLAAQSQYNTTSTVQVIMPPGGPKNSKGMMVQYHREKRSMSWRNKLLASWYRHIQPSSPKSSKAKDKPLDLVKRLSLPSPTAEEAGAVNHITATFGHILHGASNVHKIEDADSARILSPVVPHPAAFTPISIDTEVVQATDIILNFSPKSPSTEAPEVRLRLPVSADMDFSNFTFPPNSALYGLVPWSVKDVLLPTMAVDTRITQTRILPLDKEQESLKSFLTGSDFNLLQGQLRTPSHTNFSIPTRWTDDNTNDSAETIDVPYVFMGLEIHQSVEMELDGHTLRYNSIEAGHHGGQRQELSLRAASGNGEDGAFTETQKQEFLQLLEDVVMGKKFSWHSGYKLAQERSIEDIRIELEDEDVEQTELDGASVGQNSDSDSLRPIGQEGDVAHEERISSEDVIGDSSIDAAKEIEGTEITETAEVSLGEPLADVKQSETDGEQGGLDNDTTAPSNTHLEDAAEQETETPSNITSDTAGETEALPTNDQPQDPAVSERADTDNAGKETEQAKASEDDLSKNNKKE